MICIPIRWIKEPDIIGNGLLEVLPVGCKEDFSMPVETHHVDLDDVKLNEEQEFNIIIEAYDIALYEDEDNYRENSGSNLAPECFIPAGLIPLEDSDELSGQAIINGIITKTYDDSTEFGFEPNDTLLTISCLGLEFDAVIHEDFALDFATEAKTGHVLAGGFWIQGWPADMAKQKREPAKEKINKEVITGLNADQYGPIEFPLIGYSDDVAKLVEKCNKTTNEFEGSHEKTIQIEKVMGPDGKFYGECILKARNLSDLSLFLQDVFWYIEENNKLDF